MQLALFVKQQCPTCQLIAPVVAELAKTQGITLTLYSQDDPFFYRDLIETVDDRALDYSYRFNIEAVPTLLQLRGAKEATRLVGWVKEEWREALALPDLGESLIDFKPACGSLTQEPGVLQTLQVRHGDSPLQARAIDVAGDDWEACFQRGWSDGLPVVPPTAERVLTMLTGTQRAPGDLVGEVPPNRAPCTVEKVAINAVMAGCKPEYFPALLALVEAALDDKFCLHGLLCTTYFSSPVAIINGPEARRIDMNGGVNALGQGNRANATIGRALQLLVRNVGGGRPGEIDRATLGNPGKYTFCFAEDESDTNWPTLAEDQGFAREQSVVSVFAGDGVQPVFDQQSRTPESLVNTFAASLRSVCHPKIYGAADALLVICPEHRKVFVAAGWNKAKLREALHSALQHAGQDLIRGAQGIAEGMPEKLADKTLNKFRPGGLHLLTAGGTAGMFSAIISGWVATGETGSQLTSREVNGQ